MTPGDPTADRAELEELLETIGSERRPDAIAQRIADCERALTLFPAHPNDVDRLRRACAELELGQCLRLSAKGDSSTDAVRRAIAAFRGALELVEPAFGRAVWLQAMRELGETCLDDANSQPSLEDALTVFDRLARTASPQDESDVWAAAQVNLGLCYFRRRGGDRAENLWRATVSYQLALNVFDPQNFRTKRAQTLTNLGSALRVSIRGRPSENMELAIRAYHDALTLWSRETEPVSWAETASNLGNAYSERIRGERAENLDQAIVAFRHALDVFNGEGRALAWAATMTNLGATYLARLNGDPAENVELAIDAEDRALQLIDAERAPEAHARAIFHRSDALARRCLGDRAQNIEDAIGGYRLVLGVFTRETSPITWATTMLRLAAAYGERAAGDGAGNVERGVDAAEKALEVFAHDALPLDWARGTVTLARLLLQRAGAADGAGYERAIAGYRGALDAFVAAGVPSEILRAARELADALAEREKWQDSLVPYRLALNAAEELYQSSLSRRGKETELEASRGLQYRAAYAFARSGDPRFATVVLERNRARWINDALDRDRVDLERLEATNASSYAAYRAAAAHVRALEAAESSRTFGEERLPVSVDRSWYGEMTEARSALEAATAAIAATTGFETTFHFPTFDDVAAAVRAGSPLVYLTATPRGGLALVLDGAADRVEVEIVPLEQLTTTLLEELTHGSAGDPSGGWLGALSRASSAQAELFDAIEAVTRRLWEPLMQPLVERLRASGAARAYVIPCGSLSMFPLHAAWVPSGASRTYACDQFAISYAASARALTQAQRVAASSRGERALVVADPRPVNAPPLVNAEAEADAVASTFDAARRLGGKGATRAAVVDALPAVEVAHFACHGFSDATAPLQSGIVLANDERLTVADLFALDMSRARLVTLSACETGTIGTKLPDEVMSLAEAFARAGFAGIAASLWPVADRATAMLFARFYERLRPEPQAVALEPLDALRDAQMWLRTTTNAEKRAYFAAFLPEFTQDPSRVGRISGESAGEFFRALALEDPDERAHAHPFYWAGFAYVGA
jgi:CHAT domain-containing protein